MYLTWKRNEQGVYEGNTKTFNDETGKHEPIFTIEKTNFLSWRLIQKHIEIAQFSHLKFAKQAAQQIENKNPRYVTDEE